MKFVHTLIAKELPKHIIATLKEVPARSGMYNWMQVFKGEIRTYWQIMDKLEDYDIVQVNLSPKDLPLVPQIRQKLKNSSTKLILNNDWVTERWGMWPFDPWHYDNMQKMGDMVFGTEPHQVSQMINGTYCIPHPTNTEYLKHMTTDYSDDAIGFLHHWWAGNLHHPARTIEKAKKKFNIKKSKIYAFKDCSYQTENTKQWVDIVFDEIVPFLSFPDYAEHLMGDRLVYDPNPFHTYGRNGVELACFKKPVIGSDRVFSYKMLFPELTCDPYDHNKTMELFGYVLNNPNSVQEITDEAYKKVEYFNYKNSKERFMAAFDESIDRGGHEWYERNG